MAAGLVRALARNGGLAVMVLATGCVGAADAGHVPLPAAGSEPVATFSIVARDPDTGDLGVAVQSRFFGVGAVVPWARAGVGAIATQAFANTSYGPAGLASLASGAAAGDALQALTADDPQRGQRQVGIVDAAGNAATYTGEACLPWAGGRTGDGYAVQGNLLAGPDVIEAMAAGFETAPGDLATRMLAAIEAGEAAGGDARGRQSAALLVVRQGGGYGGFNDRYIDLRVDDSPAPIRELRRLLALRHAQFARTRAATALGSGDVERAIAAATEATRLAPDEGSGWLLLAAARLQAGDEAGAASAGKTALLRDPWIRRAAMRGLLNRFGQGDLLERLLQLESFARLWESLPGHESGRR